MVKNKTTTSQKEAGWAWDLPREPQLALSFYENLQLRLPRGRAVAGAK